MIFQSRVCSSVNANLAVEGGAQPASVLVAVESSRQGEMKMQPKKCEQKRGRESRSQRGERGRSAESPHPRDDVKHRSSVFAGVMLTLFQLHRLTAGRWDGTLQRIEVKRVRALPTKKCLAFVKICKSSFRLGTPVTDTFDKMVGRSSASRSEHQTARSAENIFCSQARTNRSVLIGCRMTIVR